MTLVDPEVLGWENVRRHSLGGEAVDRPKAQALALHLARARPDAEPARALVSRIEPLLLADPPILRNLDLVISCTANWSANAAIDSWSRGIGVPVAYGWMEAHALAAHAVLVSSPDAYASMTAAILASKASSATWRRCELPAAPMGAQV